MKIRQDLPQFEAETVLLIICGNQTAQFFRAGSGVIEEVAEFKISTPKYSDREGLFKSGNRGSFQVGSVYEGKKQKIHQDFRRELTQNLKDAHVAADTAGIYLFAPEYDKNEIEVILKQFSLSKVRQKHWGNYFGQHPFDLLEKIKAKQAARRATRERDGLSEEAKKILDTPTQ